MRYKWLLISLGAFVLICGAFFLGAFFYLMGASGDDSSSTFSFGKNVGLVTIEGTIFSSDQTIEDLETFRKDDDIKGVVVRVESPGGSVAASQEIYEAIKKLSATKPAVVSMGSVAASGGYYVSCGATRVIANPGTVTGSIGVRMEHVMLRDLLEWAKIHHETLKSGEYKDIGTFDRPMTPEERAIIEAVLKDLHGQFKEAVAASRKLDIATVDGFADGRVFSGKTALEMGLVDELGGLTQAMDAVKTLAKISGEPKIVKPKRKSRLLSDLLESAGLDLKQMAADVVFDNWRPVFKI